MTLDEKTVWARIQALNQAWISGKADELGGTFHEHMIAITPYDSQPLNGRKACLASWKRFVDSATVRSWKEQSPKVRLFGDAAVVTYTYEIEFVTKGVSHRERGRDMTFLVREDEEWWVVADQFSGFPRG